MTTTITAPSLQLIPVELLQASPTNPRKRFDEASIAELAESLKQFGVLQPLVVRQLDSGRIEVIAGERRYRAAKLAELEEVPCTVRPMTDDEVLEVQIIENNQREDVTPMEEARGFSQILERGIHDPKTLAEKLGRTETYVRSRAQLMKLDPHWVEQMEAGRMTIAAAMLVCRLIPEIQKELIDSLRYEGRIDARQVKHRLNSAFQKMADAPFDLGDANLHREAGACTTCPFRSSNSLFEEDRTEDVCQKPWCYKAKIKAHVDQVCQRERGVPVGADWTQSYAQDKTLKFYKGTINVLTKPTKTSKVGVWAYGENAGKVFHFNPHGTGVDLVRDEARVEAERQRKFSQKVNTLTRQALVAQCVEKFNATSGEKLALVGYELVRSMWSELEGAAQKQLVKNMGLEPVEAPSYSGKMVPCPKATFFAEIDRRKAAGNPDWSGLLLQLAMARDLLNCYIPSEPEKAGGNQLGPIAQALGIEIEPLREKISAELAEKESKPKKKVAKDG